MFDLLDNYQYILMYLNLDIFKNMHHYLIFKISNFYKNYKLFRRKGRTKNLCIYQHIHIQFEQ